MKSLYVAIFGVLFVAGGAVANACPVKCKCDKNGNVIQNYNTTNIDNSVKNTSSSNSAAAATSHSTSNSSATGGNATATGGAGGSVKDSGNSSSNSSVSNSGNFNGTVKGGEGGKGGSAEQSQHQSQSLTDVGNSTAVATNNGNNSNNADNSSDNSSNNSSSNSVTVVGDTYKAAKIPVSTAYAASLTSGFDTCLGSVSGGAQTQLLGLSLGSTKVDKGCKLIKETHLLREAGYEDAACFRMRAGKEGADIDSALKLAGVSCKKVEVVIPAPVVVEKIVTVEKEVPAKKNGG